MAVKKQQQQPAKPQQQQPAKPRSIPQSRPRDEDEVVERQIAVAAYYRAQQRGFEPGHELEDWIAAEKEVRRRMEGAA